MPSVHRTRNPAPPGKDLRKQLVGGSGYHCLKPGSPSSPNCAGELVSGLYAHWVMLQYPSRVGTSPTSLQDRVLGRNSAPKQRGVYGEDSRLGPRILIGLLLVMDWEHVWHTHSLPLKVTLSPIGKGFLQGKEAESRFLRRSCGYQ